MIKLFNDLPEALENNFNLPFRCSFKPNFLNLFYQVFHPQKKSDELLRQLSLEGLKDKFKLIFNIDLINIEKEKKFLEYKERLDHEIRIIVEMNYSGYFLIVSDYIRWAKKNKIPVGPGRGSGAGSLVAWCLSITDIDPIKFNLILKGF